jgi:DNA topoisomerase-2
MAESKDHKISSYTGDDFTCVTFEPDLQKFGMKELDEAIVSLMQKRVFIR